MLQRDKCSCREEFPGSWGSPPSSTPRDFHEKGMLTVPFERWAGICFSVVLAYLPVRKLSTYVLCMPRFLKMGVILFIPSEHIFHTCSLVSTLGQALCEVISVLFHSRASSVKFNHLRDASICLGTQGGLWLFTEMGTMGWGELHEQSDELS